MWTGHLVHTNTLHLSLNILAALTLYYGFFAKIKAAEWLACSFIIAPLISVTLLFSYPDLDWYNGLSGLLHALVAYFSIRMIRDKEYIFWVGLTILWLKVLVETLSGYLGHEKMLIEMIIITEAHLVGASIGTITAIIAWRVGMLCWRGTD